MSLIREKMLHLVFKIYNNAETLLFYTVNKILCFTLNILIRSGMLCGWGIILYYLSSQRSPALLFNVRKKMLIFLDSSFFLLCPWTRSQEHLFGDKRIYFSSDARCSFLFFFFFFLKSFQFVFPLCELRYQTRRLLVSIDVALTQWKEQQGPDNWTSEITLRWRLYVGAPWNRWDIKDPICSGDEIPSSSWISTDRSFIYGQV